jgi:hypothetical protein
MSTQPDKEARLRDLKARFDRGERDPRLSITFLVVSTAVYLLLAFDPFKWFSGLPETASARQSIRVGCFMIALWLSFVWFLLVRPLQTGIAVDFRKYGKSTAILRSDQPARFWGIFWYGVLLLTAMLMLCLWILVGGLRELRKSHTPPNERPALEAAIALGLNSRRHLRGACEAECWARRA